MVRVACVRVRACACVPAPVCVCVCFFFLFSIDRANRLTSEKTSVVAGNVRVLYVCVFYLASTALTG